MKEYARAFYRSKKWKNTSRAYMAAHNYICERCGGPASICHHKRYLNPGNIRDVSISLNPDNLECLCQDCHNKEHFEKYNRAVFDDAGNMLGVKESAALQEYRQAQETIDHLREKL